MSTIAAGTTSGTALVSTGDTTGALVLQTNGSTTAVTIATNQVVTLAQPLPVGSGGTGATSLSGITTGTATNLAGGSNGTIPYQSAAGTTQMLAVGTAGQVLQTNGAGAPTWITPSAGAMILLATVNVTSGTYATIDGYFTSAYDTYLVVGNDLVGSSPGNSLYVQVAVASSFQTSSYKYNGQGASGSTNWNTGVYASSASFINILGPLSSSEVASVNMYIYSPLNTSREKLFNWFNGISYTDPGFTVGNGRWAGGTSALSGIRIYWSTGNWSAGSFRLYGLKNT